MKNRLKVFKDNIPIEYINIFVAMISSSNHPLTNPILEYYNTIKIMRISSRKIISKGIMFKGFMIGSIDWLIEFHPKYIENNFLIVQRKSNAEILYLFTKNEIIGNIILTIK